MQIIPLSKGMVTIVDDEEFVFLNQWKWSASRSKTCPLYYAVRVQSRNSVQTSILMHRVIMKADLWQLVDHRDRNSLDNRKSNLRITNKSGNGANSKVNSVNTSGFKGVSWDKKTSSWHAYITHNQRRFNLGYFDDKVEAALAYDLAAVMRFGEFSRTNKAMGLI